MSTSNHLEFESMFVDGANDFIRIISGVDTYRPFGLLTTEDARVLLKCCDCYLFYDHLLIRTSFKLLYFVLVLYLAFSIENHSLSKHNQSTKYQVLSTGRESELGEYNFSSSSCPVLRQQILWQKCSTP